MRALVYRNEFGYPPSGHTLFRARTAVCTDWRARMGNAKGHVTPGDKAPDFTTLDDSGRRVSLADFKGKWVVLYFYPRADTPG